MVLKLLKLLKKHMITIASLGILGILYVSNLLYNSAALSVTQKEKDAKFNYILTKLNICEIFESVKDKFITNLNLFYENLDTLNILEVSALFHLLVIFAFMIIIFNIYSTIFGNEIIKYFKLEEKYPKLKKIFKLRLQFQRYYLIFNLL